MLGIGNGSQSSAERAHSAFESALKDLDVQYDESDDDLGMEIIVQEDDLDVWLRFRFEEGRAAFSVIRHGVRRDGPAGRRARQAHRSGEGLHTRIVKDA